MLHAIAEHIWPVVVATIVKMALGSLWYSPVLLAAQWRRLAGVSEAQVKASMGRAIAVDLVGSFITAVVLVHLVALAGAATIAQGALMGAVLWLGFVATTMLAALLYENRPLGLFLITGGFQLVALVIMGAILGVWR